MFAAGTLKRRLCLLIGLILLICMATVSHAEVLIPRESGKVQTDGALVVDLGNAAEGYIMVRSSKTSKKRLKVRVTCGGSDLKYDLNLNAEYEVFPLQFGKAKYVVYLYQNSEGKNYKQKGKLTVSPNGMTDELRCFLYPNQYVNYTADTECVKVAGDLCKDMTEQSKIFKAVTNYVVSNFSYDFIKSVTVQPNTLPNIDECWTKRMGICQDLSAVTCAMLRSQGVPARLIIGQLGTGTPHAWVMAVVDGQETFFDPTAELNASNKTDTYTVDRWY